MPRYLDGAQGRQSRGVLWLRAAGFVLAVALGVLAIWLIVTSTQQKRIEIGVLAGLWGLLLGAFAMFGVRRPHAEQSVPAGAELVLRQSAELERTVDAAARREHEQRLEQMLQQEVRHAITGELAELRSEIALLRNELLESLSGQLRLEHTETTRIIGSDIEALQREVNQLKAARQRVELSAAPRQPASTVVAAAEPRIVEQQAPPAPAQQAAAEAQPFAGLPRITPFTEFALDPVDETPGRHGAQSTSTADGTAADSAAEPVSSEQDEQARHAEPQHGAEGGGGRRRRESAEGHDVLARILRREAATSG